jgi:hypothetical protein
VRISRRTVLASAVVGASAGLALAFATTTSRAEVSSTLHASVGPDFQISLTFDDNTPVTSLPAGSYTVLVNDQGTAHNFHLSGPGFDAATSVENTEQATWTVNLADASRYTFQCDRHPTTLNGSFTVGTVVASIPILTVPATTTVPSSTPSPAPVTSLSGTGGTTTTKQATPVAAFLGTLSVSLSPKGAIVLTKGGKRVTSLRRGSYTLVLSDGSKKTGLTVAQISGGHFRAAFTSPAFVGRKTSSITLLPGRWKVYSPGGASIAFKVAG